MRTGIEILEILIQTNFKTSQVLETCEVLNRCIALIHHINQ